MSGAPSNTSKKDKILVIEGNAVFGEQIKDLLLKEGYEATLTGNAVEALKIIYDILPRLILLNIVLPGSDSYALLEKKDSESLLKKIPVFLVSTQGMPISMNRIPRGSMVEFIMLFKEDATEVVNKVNKFLAGSAVGQNATTTTTSKTGNKKVILWVEDDKLIGTILGKKLISYGFELVHAKNGDEAMSALSNTKPDVIVLDLVIPGMSGFDILQKIDMNQELKKIPVMILSNLDKQSDIDKAKKLGAKKFLVKASTSLEQIVEEIKKLSI